MKFDSADMLANFLKNPLAQGKFEEAISRAEIFWENRRVIDAIDTYRTQGGVLRYKTMSIYHNDASGYIPWTVRVKR